MRDYRDAKAMAQSLRQALSARAVTITHSDSLELIAKSFGFDNWNILAAKIGDSRQAVSPAERDESPAEPPPLSCSFCGRSQHEVERLIAGANGFICDACVRLTTDLDDHQQLAGAVRAAEEKGLDPYSAAERILDFWGAAKLAEYCADWDEALARKPKPSFRLAITDYLAQRELKLHGRSSRPTEAEEGVPAWWTNATNAERSTRRSAMDAHLVQAKRVVALARRVLETRRSN